MPSWYCDQRISSVPHVRRLAAEPHRRLLPLSVYRPFLTKSSRARLSCTHHPLVFFEFGRLLRTFSTSQNFSTFFTFYRLFFLLFETVCQQTQWRDQREWSSGGVRKIASFPVGMRVKSIGSPDMLTPDVAGHYRR